jgi:uncharacterized protein involved in tolerance to divalent cations
MKTVIIPLYFKEANERENKERAVQIDNLKKLYGDDADFLQEQPVGSKLPKEADAIVFPQMIGAVFAHKEEMKQLDLPMIILTSSFGTVEMWDWEIVAYLREQLKLTVFTPYNIELGKTIMRAVSAKKNMAGGKVNFLMFQDSLGEGMQAYIFKRFYWWEEECKETIEKAFGIKIIYRSWKELNERAEQISEEAALKLWEERRVPTEGV